MASGNTARALADAGIPHLEVAALTGAPEMLGGRVKTLHPTIHGGILADRSQPQHMDDLAAQGIDVIDLVVCNLYPFSSDPSIELIDVGGPTMVRAAAKNHAHVGVVVDPARVPGRAGRAARGGDALVRRPAAAWPVPPSPIRPPTTPPSSSWFDAGGAGGEAELLPPTLHLALERAEELRYGENPHQRGARYRATGQPTWWDGVVQHAGAALSYLNLFDADAAWRLVHELGGRPRRGGGHHQARQPLRRGRGRRSGRAYTRALECDPVSAFGGVVALGGPCTAAVARAVAAGPQADVIIASVLGARGRRHPGGPAQGHPAPRGSALRRGRARDAQPRWRLPGPGRRPVRDGPAPSGRWPPRPSPRPSSGATSSWPGGCAPGPRRTPSWWSPAARPWASGPASRAGWRRPRSPCARPGTRAVGAVAASDAFFPFRDGLDVLASAGVAVVVQPGGSVRDGELIAAADEHGTAMVLTGERHFRH